jgi:hypothetical protein
MKKYIKILFILPLLFITSISAKEIDMQGEYFDKNELYPSGNVYKNAGLRSTKKEIEFDGIGGISTFLKYELVTNDGYLYNVRNIGRMNIFDIEDQTTYEFRIPRIYDNEVLWKYSLDTYNESPYEQFYVYLLIPKFTVECDDKEVMYGNTNKCSLYMTITDYSYSYVDYDYNMRTNNAVTSDYSFDLISDDYNIKNVSIINDYATYNNGNVNVSLFLDYYKKAYRQQNEELMFNRMENIRTALENVRTEVCVQNYEEVPKSPRVGATEIKSGCMINKYTMKLKMLDFDIESIENETKDGMIKISDLVLSVPTSDFDGNGNIQTSSFYSSTESYTIPMIGEVKGVEENPKTGLFNYLLLIIPVVLLGIGFNLLRRVNIFKKI